MGDKKNLHMETLPEWHNSYIFFSSSRTAAHRYFGSVYNRLLTILSNNSPPVISSKIMYIFVFPARTYKIIVMVTK